MQTGLTHTWTTRLPLLQPCSPATLVANILRRELGASVSSYAYIDFCAGAGGPTPHIERALNKQLSTAPRASSSSPPSSYAAAAAASLDYGHDHPAGNGRGGAGVDFVLTDLHPHVESWEKAARDSPHLTYVPTPVDAAAAPRELIQRGKAGGKGVFRLFNLAFHHFDDVLARAILKNTVETSEGFGCVLPIPQTTRRTTGVDESDYHYCYYYCHCYCYC